MKRFAFAALAARVTHDAGGDAPDNVCSAVP